MKDGDIAYLVLQYLRKKGATAAASAFVEAVPVQEDAEPPLAHSLEEGSGALGGLLLTTVADSDPTAYVEQYNALAAWVDSSLDLVRPELSRLLYPLLVATYLALVEAGAGPAAAALLAAQRRRMVEVGGRVAAARAAELQELAGVTGPGQLASSPWVAAVRGSPTMLRLTTTSFELLMHQLQGAKLWLMMALVNSALRFQLHDGPPLVLEPDAAGDEFTAGVLQSRGNEDSGVVNARRLVLGLLRDDPEEAWAAGRLQEEEEALAAAAAAAAATTGGGPGGAVEGGGGGGVVEAAPGGAGGGAPPLSKKARAAKERARDALRSRRQELEEARVEPWIPLAPYSDALRVALEGDLPHRVHVAASPAHMSNVHVAFFSAVNTGGAATCMTFSQDSRMVALGGSDCGLRLFRLDALGAGREGLRRGLEAAAGQGQGGSSSSRSRGVDVDMEDVADLQDQLEQLAQQGVVPLCGHEGPVTCADFSPDSTQLLSGSADGSVRLWSTALGRCLAAYTGHLYPVWGVAACPHGAYFASGGRDRTARLWATEHSWALRVFTGHSGDVDVVSWHPNSHYIASGSSDRTVRLWDAGAASCVRLLAAQAAPITSLAFSPDGRTLAAGGEDGSIALYDLGQARRTALLRGHSGPVWSLGFSRGAGALLASGGADATLRLWSTAPSDSSLAALLATATAGGDELGGAGSGGDGAGGGGAAGRGANGSGASSAPAAPHSLVSTYPTRATPVVGLAWSRRNLLLAGGPVSWSRPSGGQGARHSHHR